MKDWIERPAFVLEAARAKRGLKWILEILVFFAVFYAAQSAMSLVITPVALVRIFTNPDFWAASASGDFLRLMELITEISADNFYTLAMLFSQALMILVVCLFCKLLQKRRMTSLGFCKQGLVREYLIGLAVGFAMFSLAVLGSVLSGALTIDGVSPDFSLGIFLLYVVGFLIQGMAEEVLCRSYFMVSFARRHPLWLAVLLNALLFMALHLLNSGITLLSLLNLALFGVFASLYFIRRGNIWGIGALHSVWNLVQGNFYGIKVSGIQVGTSVLSSTASPGLDLLNGGDFGLEGSIFVTLVLVLGIGILWFWKGKRREHPQEIL